jgi:hypothetical protein
MEVKSPQRSNPKAKARKLQQEWDAMIKRQSVPLSRGAKSMGVSAKALPKKQVTIDPVKRIPSLMTPGGSTAKIEPKVYTGTKIIGIATMHKSNMVPIFNQEAAIDVAQMRRN